MVGAHHDGLMNFVNGSDPINCRLRQYTNGDFCRIQHFANGDFCRIQHFANGDSSRIQRFVNGDSSRIQHFVNGDSCRIRQYTNGDLRYASFPLPEVCADTGEGCEDDDAGDGP